MGSCTSSEDKKGKPSRITSLYEQLVHVNCKVWTNRKQGVFDIETERESQRLQLLISGTARPIPKGIIPEGTPLHGLIIE